MSTEQIYGIPEQPPMPSVLLGKEYQPDRPISETFYQALEEQNPFMTSTQLESYLSNRGKSTSLSPEKEERIRLTRIGEIFSLSKIIYQSVLLEDYSIDDANVYPEITELRRVLNDMKKQVNEESDPEIKEQLKRQLYFAELQFLLECSKYASGIVDTNDRKKIKEIKRGTHSTKLTQKIYRIATPIALATTLFISSGCSTTSPSVISPTTQSIEERFIVNGIDYTYIFESMHNPENFYQANFDTQREYKRHFPENLPAILERLIKTRDVATDPALKSQIENAIISIAVDSEIPFTQDQINARGIYFQVDPFGNLEPYLDIPDTNIALAKLGYRVEYYLNGQIVKLNQDSSTKSQLPIQANSNLTLRIMDSMGNIVLQIGYSPLTKIGNSIQYEPSGTMYDSVLPLDQYGITEDDLVPIREVVNKFNSLGLSGINRVQIVPLRDNKVGALYDHQHKSITINTHSLTQEDDKTILIQIYHESAHDLFATITGNYQYPSSLELENEYYNKRLQALGLQPHGKIETQTTFESPYLTRYNDLFDRFNSLGEKIYAFFGGGGGHPENPTELFASAVVYLYGANSEELNRQFQKLNEEEKRIVIEIFRTTLLAFHPDVSYARISSQVSGHQPYELSDFFNPDILRFVDEQDAIINGNKE